jgi:hypothetical protein
MNSQNYPALTDVIFKKNKIALQIFYSKKSFESLPVNNRQKWFFPSKSFGCFAPVPRIC